MAYTIVKSDGTVLTTIADGQINTTSTSLQLPGKNYAGYGQYLDTNFVHLVENFADTEPPPNPLRGQLWYNTNSQTLYVCPTDGQTVASAWLALASTSSSGTTTFGAVTASGNLSANNATITNTLQATDIICTTISVSSIATIQQANIVVGNITTLTTGANTNPGTITGNWTLSAGSKLQATYADLAEKYIADAEYDPGTVLVFGGEHEVTISNSHDSHAVAGVVSTNPAYTMNSGCQGEHVVDLALQGRVPVKVHGPVAKGDLMVSGPNGHAVANNMARAGTIIGKSLENFISGNILIISNQVFIYVCEKKSPLECMRKKRPL